MGYKSKYPVLQQDRLADPRQNHPSGQGHHYSKTDRGTETRQQFGMSSQIFFSPLRIKTFSVIPVPTFKLKR